MERETVIALTGTFEGHAQQTEGGIEFWLARDLQHLLCWFAGRTHSFLVHAFS